MDGADRTLCDLIQNDFPVVERPYAALGERLGTSEDDVAARALYERMGFRNREGREDGPIMYVYERGL